MISRHNIRQTAVQFLYGVGLQPEGEKQVDELCDFSSWDIVLEPAKADLARSRAKAIAHITRGRADKIRILQLRSDAAILAMKDDLSTSGLRDGLEDILTRETSLEDAIKSIKTISKTADRTDFQILESSFAPLFLLNETLLHLRSRVLTMIKDFPRYGYVLHPLSAVFNKMQDIGEQLKGVQTPEQSTSKSEIINVVEGVADMEELRKETEKLVRSVLSQLGELDGAVAKVTDNFSPTRISPVDRAILRIAAYELKNCLDLPVPVIIKEAILLAESYSVNEATKFVNGVLAGISGIYRNQDSKQS